MVTHHTAGRPAHASAASRKAMAAAGQPDTAVMAAAALRGARLRHVTSSKGVHASDTCARLERPGGK